MMRKLQTFIFVLFMFTVNNQVFAQSDADIIDIVRTQGKKVLWDFGCDYVPGGTSVSEKNRGENVMTSKGYITYKSGNCGRVRAKYDLRVSKIKDGSTTIGTIKLCIYMPTCFLGNVSHYNWECKTSEVEM